MANLIKFGTDGWRAIIGDQFTLDNLSRVTEATALWLKTTYATPSVMLGYDCRFNGSLFAEYVASHLAQRGIKVFISPGFVSTPMVSLATMQHQCSAGIILTASHNPPEYSGFKLKGDFGGPAFPSIIADVEARIPEVASRLPQKFEELVDSRHIEYYDMEALYLNHLREAFDLKAIHESGLKIGYDAMYGAGQKVFRKAFPQAITLHTNFNPGFEGQAPEPIERNLKPFQDLILKEGIQFGLATDGDADRIGLFDEQARFVDSHLIILLLIQYLHKYKGMDGKVVITFSCSSRIETLCKLYGLEVQVTKIGFKYIGEIMTREKVLVGGEESGGIAVAGFIPERDGIYIGLLILEMMAKAGKTLSQLVEDLYAEVGRFAFARNDLHITEELKQAVLNKCANEGFAAFGTHPVERAEQLDGYKFHMGPGRWIMVRPSGTEPVLRVYSEAENETVAQEILGAAVTTLKAVAV
jgi:phosphomannomutase